jgi:hypothetical protein
LSRAHSSGSACPRLLQLELEGGKDEPEVERITAPLGDDRRRGDVDPSFLDVSFEMGCERSAEPDVLSSFGTGVPSGRKKVSNGGSRTAGVSGFPGMTNLHLEGVRTGEVT